MRTAIIFLSLSMATLSFAKPDATTTGYLSTYEELAYIESTTIVRSGAGSHTKPCLDPATGDDNRDGTLANPWRTLEALTLHEKQMTPVSPEHPTATAWSTSKSAHLLTAITPAVFIACGLYNHELCQNK